MISDTALVTVITTAISGAFLPKKIWTTRPRLSLTKNDLPAAFLTASYEEDFKADGVSLCNSCTKANYKIVGLFSLPATGTVLDFLKTKAEALALTVYQQKIDGYLNYPSKTFIDQELVLDSGEPVCNLEMNFEVHLIG